VYHRVRWLTIAITSTACLLTIQQYKLISTYGLILPPATTLSKHFEPAGRLHSTKRAPLVKTSHFSSSDCLEIYMFSNEGAAKLHRRSARQKAMNACVALWSLCSKFLDLPLLTVERCLEYLFYSSLIVLFHFQQITQLSRRDLAAGWVSYSQKWKTGTERQYFTDIIGLSSTTVIIIGQQSNRIR